VFASASKQRLNKFNPQNVANMALAFATLKYRDEKLLAARSSGTAAEQFRSAGHCQAMKQ